MISAKPFLANFRIADNTPRTGQGVLWLEWLRQGTRALVKWPTLFIAESFGGWDGDGVAGGQQAGEQCAKSEESRRLRTDCLQLKALCIQWARTAPRKLSNARPITMPAAALISAMRAAIHNTCVRGAPSARRTPNSVVRCATL